MRIAHVTATFPPYYGGTGNVCYENARVLAGRGHDVHVFTAAYPGEPDDPPGVVVHRLQPAVRVGNAPVLPQLRSMDSFDLVHLHYPFFSGAELVALSRRRFVATYHHDVELPGPLGWGVALHGRTLGRAVLRRAERLCVTSHDYFRHSRVAADYATAAAHIRELPNGVDLTRFQPAEQESPARRARRLPEDAFVALFVGGMDQAHAFKGVPVLLHALARTPEAWGLCVGDGALRPGFERLAAELGIQERVRFTGRVSDAELPALYQAADVLVLPSQTRGEAFGVVLLEALASGTPVIASDLPGVRSLVAPGLDGYLVEPGDAEALARTLGHMMNLPHAMRRSMGRAGRAKVEQRYGWEHIGDRLEALYSEVLEARAGRTVA